MRSLGIDLDKEDAVLRKHETWPKDEPKRGKGGHRHANLTKRFGKPPLSEELNLLQMTQDEIDAQAKAAILDMFPAIPHENLYQIILHSFELVWEESLRLQMSHSNKAFRVLIKLEFS